MNKNLIRNIIKLKESGAELHNIKQTKNLALQQKMYDLIIFINNNFNEYLDLVSSIEKGHLK